MNGYGEIANPNVPQSEWLAAVYNFSNDNEFMLDVFENIGTHLTYKHCNPDFGMNLRITIDPDIVPG